MTTLWPGILTKEEGYAVHENAKLSVKSKAEAAAYRVLVAQGKAPEIIVDDDLNTAFARLVGRTLS